MNSIRIVRILSNLTVRSFTFRHLGLTVIFTNSDTIKIAFFIWDILNFQHQRCAIAERIRSTAKNADFLGYLKVKKILSAMRK